MILAAVAAQLKPFGAAARLTVIYANQVTTQKYSKDLLHALHENRSSNMLKCKINCYQESRFWLALAQIYYARRYCSRRDSSLLWAQGSATARPKVKVKKKVN